jgi:hypothetical protein
MRSLRLAEEWGADEAYEDILQHRLGFHDVPCHDALQRVWPHNMNLGRDADGDVIGAIGVSGASADEDEHCAIVGAQSVGLVSEPAKSALAK